VLVDGGAQDAQRPAQVDLLFALERIVGQGDGGDGQNADDDGGGDQLDQGEAAVVAARPGRCRA